MNCSSCSKPYRIINQKYKLCQLCNHRRLHPEGKKQTVLKRTPIKYKRKKTGERELFRQLWSIRRRECVNCNGNLGNEAKVFFFAHIKGKGAYPELRLQPKNIMLLCSICHKVYDQGTKEHYDSRKGINKNKFVGNQL